MRPLVAALLLTSCAPAQVTVVMNAQNDSGQDGYATLTAVGGQTKVLVIVHKSDSPDPQPVHFHPGRSGEIGIKFVPTSDAPLTGVGLPNMAAPGAIEGEDPAPPTDGGVIYSAATLDVPFSTLTDGSYVINVHDSRDFALYTSCGNIN